MVPPDTSDAAVPGRHGIGVDSRAEALMQRGTSEFDRGLSFYDAIYGFAVTLLIANLDAPQKEAWESWSAFSDSGVPAQLFGFVLSFIVIAVFWRVNVRVLKRITGMDGLTTVANLVAAGLVILIPFTTQGMSDPETSSLALPTAFYALNIALVALAQLAVFEVARMRGLEAEPMSSRANTLFVLDALLTPVVFLVSIPIAFWIDADAARWTWASLVVLAPLSGRFVDRSRRSDG